MQRTRAPGTVTGSKLAVPKPVNLPSIKKVRPAGSSRSPPTGQLTSWPLAAQEHAGNDPSTQLVPSNAAGGGWSKPEEPQPAPQQPAAQEPPRSALTAGSNWASQNRSGSSGWVPPVREGPYAPGSTYPKSSFPVDRHLNPEEYPSLAATAQQPKPAKHKAAHEQAPAQVWIVLISSAAGNKAWQ
jgi:hypothetical protein